MKTIAAFQASFAAYLNENRFDKEPVNLYEPVNYIMDLGGKRIRPVLVLLAHSLFKDDHAPALPAALAVEIFHNFSLVHDDIMDEAPVRRGKATIHQKFGLPAGILSGDVMLIYAYQFLARSKPETVIPDLMKVFNEIAIEVCEGQQMDMDFEQDRDCNLSLYLQMIEGKTAALIGGSLELGAIVAEAPESDLFHLRSFGRKLGVAFQLQDDFLDTYGDPEKFGKKPGGDILRNKKTFLVLKARELANAKQLAVLDHWMNGTIHDESAKIKAIMEVFEELQIREKTREAMIRFHTESMEHLGSIAVDSDRKNGLVELSELLFDRDF